MLGQWHPWSENETVRIDSSAHRLVSQIDCRSLVVFQQPQHASLDLLNDLHPTVEYLRCQLIIAIETAKDEAVLRQPQPGAGERSVADAALGIVRLVSIRQ